MPKIPPCTVHMVERPEQFPAMLEAIHQAPRVGVDTEFMREGRYFAKLCLIQLVAGDQIWLVDPLVAGEPEELWPALCRPGLEVILHSGFQDIQILFERTGRLPGQLFDVQIAAALAGLGYSLAYNSLVHACTGVRLHKGSTFSMWDKRPLTREQLDYAADDVRYLLPITDYLSAALNRLSAEDSATLPGFDRLASARQETALVYDVSRLKFDPEAVLAGLGKFAARMTPAQRTLLRELLAWRDRVSRQADRPPSGVAKDETLAALARKPPRGPSELSHFRGLAIFRDKAAQQDLFDTVERAKSLPGTDWPEPEPFVDVPASAGALVDFLCAALHLRAEQVGIAPELLGRPRDVTDWLIHYAQQRAGAGQRAPSRLSTGWRGVVVGSLLEQLLHGEALMVPSAGGPDGWPALKLERRARPATA